METLSKRDNIDDGSLVFGLPVKLSEHRRIIEEHSADIDHSAVQRWVVKENINIL